MHEKCRKSLSTVSYTHLLECESKRIGKLTLPDPLHRAIVEGKRILLYDTCLLYTSQLVSFNLMEYYLPMIALGFFLYFACKKKGLKSGGQILFSFGILFMGLAIMSNAMAPLAEYEGFRYLMATFGEYKILGLLCGILLTAVIQSLSLIHI